MVAVTVATQAVVLFVDSLSGGGSGNSAKLGRVCLILFGIVGFVCPIRFMFFTRFA